MHIGRMGPTPLPRLPTPGRLVRWVALVVVCTLACPVERVEG